MPHTTGTPGAGIRPQPRTPPCIPNGWHSLPAPLQSIQEQEAASQLRLQPCTPALVQCTQVASYPRHQMPAMLFLFDIRSCWICAPPINQVPETEIHTKTEPLLLWKLKCNPKWPPSNEYSNVVAAVIKKMKTAYEKKNSTVPQKLMGILQALLFM